MKLQIYVITSYFNHAHRNIGFWLMVIFGVFLLSVHICHISIHERKRDNKILEPFVQEVKILTNASPTHIILKPGKLIGALSERNKAEKRTSECSLHLNYRKNSIYLINFLYTCQGAKNQGRNYVGEGTYA